MRTFVLWVCKFDLGTIDAYPGGSYARCMFDVASKICGEVSVGTAFGLTNVLEFSGFRTDAYSCLW